VDDEVKIGELLREVLSDDDHKVVLAISDRQGLQMIAKEQPDLVFLDFMMPVPSGAGMLSAMMENADMAKIPVMSSLPEASVAERAHGHVGTCARLSR
jgi:DNA-binding response OmpR family regulator